MTDNFGLFSKHFFGHLGWVYWTNIFTLSESIFIGAFISVKKESTFEAKFWRKLTLNPFCYIFGD